MVVEVGSENFRVPLLSTFKVRNGHLRLKELFDVRDSLDRSSLGKETQFSAPSILDSRNDDLIFGVDVGVSDFDHYDGGFLIRCRLLRCSF